MRRDHRDRIPGTDFFTQPATNAFGLVDDARGVESGIFGSWKFVDAVNGTNGYAHFTTGAAVRIDERLRAALAWLWRRSGWHC